MTDAIGQAVILLIYEILVTQAFIIPYTKYCSGSINRKSGNISFISHKFPYYVNILLSVGIHMQNKTIMSNFCAV